MNQSNADRSAKLGAKKKIALFLLAPMIVLIFLYASYFLHLTRVGLVGPSAENEAFARLAQALLYEKVESNEKFKIAHSVVSGPDMCSFWKFEAIRTHCKGVSLVVPDFEEGEKARVIDLTRFVTKGLAKPCHQLHLIPEDEKVKISSALGCGERKFSYKIRVQARASSFVSKSSGGGRYINEHIYTYSLIGEI